MVEEEEEEEAKYPLNKTGSTSTNNAQIPQAPKVAFMAPMPISTGNPSPLSQSHVRQFSVSNSAAGGNGSQTPIMPFNDT
jgi:hypothetical protein